MVQRGSRWCLFEGCSTDCCCWPYHSSLIAEAQQTSSGVLTLKTTSQLVFMDVTVLDGKGNPVVRGLTRDDFTITEDKEAPGYLLL